ncbi:MAG: ACT domain-containing protein [Chloroflexota bacterium]|nr:ACT domain-containing protein [Chloroflexota bacterium]MDE2885566.1 ACT domain-containing protein [Chloroflexota bacterium]
MNQHPADQPAPSRRIIVIVPDRPGGLAQVTAALAEEEINIEAIDGRRAWELGVITLSTNDDDAALRALLKAGLRAVTSDVIVFHLPDRPGALAGVAQLFSEHHVNARTIHIVHRLEGHAIVAVTTDDDDLARTLIGSESLL